jgi:dGTPase
VYAEHLELKQYLRRHLYRHYRVLRMTTKAQRVVRELFGVMFERRQADAGRAPGGGTQAGGGRRGPGRARAVADYIAGMTDRFAILEHRRLFDPSERT